MKDIMKRWNNFVEAENEQDKLEEGLAKRLGGALLSGMLALSSVAKASPNVPVGVDSTEQSVEQGVSQEEAIKAIAFLKLWVDAEDDLASKEKIGGKAQHLAWQISAIRDGHIKSLDSLLDVKGMDQKIVESAKYFDEIKGMSDAQKARYLSWATKVDLTGQEGLMKMIVHNPLY